MADKKRRILEMLAEGKINAAEANRLLELLESPAGSEGGASNTSQMHKGQRKYLRVVVQPDPEGKTGTDVEQVNIRVPMTLLYAGIKLAAFMPSDAAHQVNDALRNKGIDMDVGNLKVEDLEPLIDALGDLEIDVQKDSKERVRVYVE